MADQSVGPWHAHIREIRSKERGRHDPRTGRVYTTAATREYEALIKTTCRIARGRAAMVEGWCVVGVFILDLIPTSWRTKRGEPTLQARRAAWQREPARASEDVDNVIKAALDGANGAWYRGDAKVLPVPWRGWTADPARAGLHLVLWPAATPAAAFHVVAGDDSQWATMVLRLSRPPADWMAP